VAYLEKTGAGTAAQARAPGAPDGGGPAPRPRPQSQKVRSQRVHFAAGPAAIIVGPLAWVLLRPRLAYAVGPRQGRTHSALRKNIPTDGSRPASAIGPDLLGYVTTAQAGLTSRSWSQPIGESAAVPYRGVRDSD